MKYEDFVLLVQMMRDAQSEYFRTRETEYLQESRALEKQVDDEISRFFTGQKELF